MKRLLLLSLVLLLAVQTQAQPICQVKEYNVNNGLAQSIVTGILQDQKGIIWLSTWNGLNKFDGYTFKNYKASSTKEYSLTHNRINQISETIDGNLWCKTYDNKAYIFDRKSEQFIDVLKNIGTEIYRENKVSRIFALKKGVAWITCEDGYCFRVDEIRYKEKEGIEPFSTYNKKLKGNEIIYIYQDSDADEWILTNKGITIVGDKKIDSDLPFKLIFEHKGLFYLVSTSNKLAVYQPQTGSIKIVDIPYAINTINVMTSAGKESIALGTDNGMVLFNPSQNTFQKIDIRSNTQPSNEVLSIYEDRQGEFWIFSKAPGVTRLNVKDKEMQHLYTPQNEVVSYGRDSRNYIIFEDHQDVLWVMPTKGNFSYYDREGKQLKLYYTDPNNSQSAFTPLIRYYDFDKQGNLWIVTSRGVKKMTFFPKIFQRIQPDESGMEVRAFLSDRFNRFWVASKSGYIRIYNPDGTLQGYLSKEGKITLHKSSFPANIYSFHETSDGTIFMGSKFYGLYQLTPKGANQFGIKNYTHQADNHYSLSGNDVYDIFTDSQNNIWVGCYNDGLNLMKKDQHGEIQFISHMNELKNYPIEGFLNVRTIAEIGDSVLLIGTTSGLISFKNHFDQPEEIKFYLNKHNADNRPGLIGSDVMHIYTDSYNHTYVSTFTGGINKIVSNNLLCDSIEFKSYTTQDGLASDLVLSIIEDSRRQLWVVTENALSKFDTQNETFDNYDRTVLHQELNFTEAIPEINSKGQLVVGTDMGFLNISPDQIRKSNYTPPIIFTGLKIHGKPAGIQVDDIEELTLDRTQRNIIVEFAALDYSQSENIMYAYRLKGLKEEWNSSDKSRSANYVNLPAGEFVLEVKSTNSDGVWTENVRSLHIKVVPTFSETSWAWVLYVLLFILFTGLVTYVLFYIYRLRHRVNMEQQLSNIKLKFFTDISHELRTPLTLIASPISEVLESEPISQTAREHLTVAQKNTDRMLRLINQILDFRKIQNHKMKLMVEQTELISFLMRVVENFQVVAYEKQITLELQSKEEELYLWIDKDKIEKVVFNLLSNAFKFTPAKKSIYLRVEKHKDTLSLSVIDQGIGIAIEQQASIFKRFETSSKLYASQPSSGIGLSLVKELVELHHGEVKVSSKLGAGSCFTVTLPMDRRILENDNKVELILTDATNEQESKEDLQNNALNVTENSSPEEETERQTILIVEDNNELRNLLRMILTKSYTILEAKNGEEGLRLALQSIPDMILSDVMMPRMDGLEMISKIKESKDICHIPIILLSAKSSLDDRIAALEHGIDDYMTKPFSSTYLKARINTLFAQRKQLQELFISKLGQNESKLLKESKIQECAWTPSQPDIIPHDKLFIEQTMAYLEQEMDNPDLTIDDFANKLSLSRTIFYRKLKTITGLSPVDFIREVRIKRAMQLIESNVYNFSQVAYMTGFSDPKYFSRCFKKYCGLTPSEYKSSLTKE